MHDPDVIVRAVAGWSEPGPYVGWEAVMRFIQQLRDTWDVDKFEVISDFIDAADPGSSSSSGVASATALGQTWR